MRLVFGDSKAAVPVLGFESANVSICQEPAFRGGDRWLQDADCSSTTIEPACRKAVTGRVLSALMPSQLDHFMPNFGGNHEPAVYTRKVEMVNKDFVMNAKLNLCNTGIR